jgi:hypothetical protein
MVLRVENLSKSFGKVGVSGMALLDKANTSTYGNPQITKVNIGVGKNPGILVSGHDLGDLEQLLKQTEGTGVDVYTHSEMLPAHYYPHLKKYKHLIGNYGNAWWKQKEEFEAFNGPILLTTNCLVPPKDTYKDKDVDIKLFNCAKRDKNDIITEIFKSKMVLVGSSTINNGILTAVAGILEMMKGLKFTNKKAAAFGSYGWSGEAVKIITQQLKDAKFDVVNEGIRELWNPDEEALERCREYGRSLV